MHCADCGAILNETSVFDTHKELRQAWPFLCLGGPLNTRECANGCRSTFTDCNFNTKMQVYDGDTNEHLPFEKLDDLPRNREEVI
jgi:hypothetical protein